jgi:hypothetical protein
MINELRYWLALNHLPMVGAARSSDWLKKVADVTILFTADRQTLAGYGLTSAAILQAPNWALVDQALNWLSANSTHYYFA